MTTRENRYEALFILRAAGTEEDMTRTAAQLEEPIKRLGGNLEGRQGLGRRKLAFRIAKQSEGHYHLLKFSAPTERLVELERVYRLNEAILRFLIVSDDHAAAPKPTPTAQPTRTSANA